MKLYIISYLALILALTACTDHNPVESPAYGSTIQVTVNVAATDIIPVGRASDNEENLIENISVYVFDGTAPDATLILRKDYGSADMSPLNGNRRKLTIDFTHGNKARPSYCYYFVANYPLQSADGLTPAALENVIDTAAPVSPFVMSARVTGSAVLAVSDVMLVRSAVRMSVTNEVATSDFALTGAKFTVTDLQLWGGNSAASILSGALSLAPARESGATISATAAAEGIAPVIYTCPCAADAAGLLPFAIIGGKYLGTRYFYRVSLLDADSRPIDLKPNHHYELKVTDVTGPGYTSAEEAARRAVDEIDGKIKVDIIDHQPKILNIAFDGRNELGVTDSIMDAEGNGLTADLYVKTYSADGDYSRTPCFSISAVDAEWISTPVQQSVTDLSGEDAGARLYHYTVTLQSNNIGDTREGILTVDWNGLSRPVVVTQYREFLGNTLGNARLEIRHSGNPANSFATIADYWTFVAGNGTRTSLKSSSAYGNTDTPLLYGIKPAKMGGKIRNEGFHFPVMHGDFTYHYHFSFTNPKFDGWTYRIEIDPDSRFNNNITFSTLSGTVTLDTDAFNFTLGASTFGYEYIYDMDALRIILTPPAGHTAAHETVYRYDLYHTGLFDYDDHSLQWNVKAGVAANWYYYEVVRIDLPSGARYILDRNIGAKSAGMYIMDIDGNNFLPADAGWPYDADAQGEYLSISNSRSNYMPIIHSGICPDGYVVPQANVWDEIGESLELHALSYPNPHYTSYYEAPDARGGRIYFPKSRMYQPGQVQGGDANSGYYWSRTIAYGAGGNSVGYWLQALKLSGVSASLVRYRSLREGASGGSTSRSDWTGLSVRGINRTDQAPTNVTSFSVTGATHVFLYATKDGNRVDLTRWPGQQITNYAQASASNPKSIPFIYNSSVYTSDDIYVIFNRVTDDGSLIYTKSNGLSGTNLTPAGLTGFYVGSTKAYNFNNL